MSIIDYSRNNGGEKFTYLKEHSVDFNIIVKFGPNSFIDAPYVRMNAT